MGRKPLEQKTVAENVLEWGTGGINIDDCRIGNEKVSTHSNGVGNTGDNGIYGTFGNQKGSEEREGRFPANVILDEVAGKELDKQSGTTKGGKNMPPYQSPIDNPVRMNSSKQINRIGYEDTGGASRFFYCPKTSKSDRNEGCDELDEKGYNINQAHNSKTLEERYGLKSKNNHPTVKPTDLMRYLVRLVTPKGGTVLDPFMGSGSTGKGAVLEGMNFVGIERETEYYEIAKNRISAVNKEQHHEKFFE
jgi:site-specific DNA-methyltransferase (adenine-specific)